MYDHQKKEKFEDTKQQDQQKKTKEKEQARKNALSSNNQIQKPTKKKSRFSQIKKTDSVFGLALMAGGLKDLLDISQASGGGYILVVIMAIIIFIFIGLMIMIAVSTGGGGGIHILLILFGGTATEMLPGISLLPVTMGIVIAIYLSVLKKRKKNAENIEQVSYA